MEQFSEMVKSHMEQRFGNGYQIKVCKVRKNNGVCRTGLNIIKKDKVAVPTVYLDFYLEEYQKGRELEKIYQDIVSVYEQHKDDLPFDSSILNDFEKAKDKICLKLINLEKNQAVLEEAPYITFHDLAIVFYVSLLENEGSFSIDIHHSMLEEWGQKLDLEELYSLALQNTQRIFKEELIPMEELLADLLKAKPESEPVIRSIEDKKEVSMYVASNTLKINGAAVLLYPGFLKAFADKTGGDFYILPSSVHETIFIPDDGKKRIQELALMVKEVNETQVLPEEILSDNLYLYSRQDDNITICSQQK
ncbi:MAG: hypothetical protein HFI75_08035 [Lachnospiraceae bacterium]|nr:hypothetical protein [Lachnospiraceae bacterium]